MTHTENNTQSEVKGTAPDQSRNRSRTRERSNKAVNSIGRNKIRIRKCLDQSLLPWSLGHLKATFIATFFSSRFQWKSKQVISKVYSLIPLLGRTGRWKLRMCTDPHKSLGCVLKLPFLLIPTKGKQLKFWTRNQAPLPLKHTHKHPSNKYPPFDSDNW